MLGIKFLIACLDFNPNIIGRQSLVKKYHIKMSMIDIYFYVGRRPWNRGVAEQNWNLLELWIGWCSPAGYEIVISEWHE